MVLSPRESSKLIASSSSHVKLDSGKLPKVAGLIVDEFVKIGNNSWYTKLHPEASHPEAVDWIFILDLLNFSFWPNKEDKKYTVEYQGEQQTGYFALCAAIKNAIESEIIEPKVTSLDELSDEQLTKIFEGKDNVQIPLLSERILSIRSASMVLKKKYEGTFLSCLLEAKGSAMKLLEIVVNNFDTFRDIAVFSGIEVAFYKRAQILVADICLCYAAHEKSVVDLPDWDQLTAFADYRVPQVLAHFGILVYSDHLKKKLSQGEELPNGSLEEVEIRGLTIYACENLKEEVNNQLKERYPNHPNCNSVNIDNFLWEYRRKFAQDVDRSGNMHKTRCIYY